MTTHNTQQEGPAMTTTTLQTYAGQRAGNYSSLPSIDVEVLPEVHHCETCGEAVVYNAGGYTLGGGWEHVDTAKAWEAKPHRPQARLGCGYCHTDDPTHVQFVQANWSDETRCSRCGGVTGYAIGD